MKRFVSLFLVLLLVFSLGVSAFAADEDEAVIPQVDSFSPLDSLSSSETSVSSSVSDSTSYDSPSDLLDTPERYELSGVTLYSVSTGEESASGLKKVILDLLGTYSPVVLEYTYESNNGYTNYLREVQPDYPWIASAVIFAIVLWCIFKMGGGMLSG